MAFTVLFGANVKPNNVLTWHQISLTKRGIMKRKQHLQSFLSVCNKRLLSATTRHAGKRPSEQFAVIFLRTIYLKNKRVNCTQEHVFVIFKLNLLLKRKKLKDLKMGQDITVTK